MAVSRDVSRRGVAASLALLLGCAAAYAGEIDTAHSRFGFSLQTRWGQTVQGRFPRYAGEVDTLPDARQQVRLRLDTRAVEIIGDRRYTDFSRSEKFFDATRHPTIEFLSDPYPASLLQHGGDLAGMLTLRGVSRREVFVVAPATCARPLHTCDVVARGSVRRDDYGMDAYDYLLRSRVRFTLNVRLRPQDKA